jgi:hypothetical protein
MDNGPGTPLARLSYLLDELAKRFPGVHCPIMSDPAEPKYLAAIDRLIEKSNYSVTKEQYEYIEYVKHLGAFCSPIQDTPEPK